MSGFQSLHCHTTFSDGKLTHEELLNSAGFSKLSAIAFTDHDTVPDAKVLKKLNLLKNHPVKWIVGIEISSGLPVESPGPNGPHIVGLFIDPTNTELINYCKHAQSARMERMQEMVKHLTDLGFTISEQDCLKASGGETVGRPHIVQALNSHPENEKVTQTLINKMAADAQSDPKIKSQHDELLASGPHQLPYRLFLSEGSYFKGIYMEKKTWTDFDQSVKLIRNAGGLAIFAHFFTEKKKIPITRLEELLKTNRIDGVETVYGLWEYGTPKEQEINTDRQTIRDLLTRYHKLVSGGADIHSAQDITNFISHAQFASETVGMAEKIIAQSGVSTVWSSFPE